MALNNNSSQSPVTVFVDRDGTINVNLPFPNVNTPEKLVLIEGAAKALRGLNDLGCRILVVTNQAGICNPQNDLTQKTFDEVTERLRLLLDETAGARIDDQFVCPHQTKDKCECRKPATGLFVEARQKYPDIVFADTFVIGDRTDDMLAAHAIGAKSVLVLTGHGRETLRQLEHTDVTPKYVAMDLAEATKVIGKLLGGQ